MSLPAYESSREKGKASLALALATGAIVLGALTFWLVLEKFGMGIVVLGPMIGVGMLVAAGICFYWLSKSNAQEKAMVRRLAQIASGLLVLAGLAAVAFLGMGGGGIYK